MIWKCIKCGNCCELFAPIVFDKECEYFKDRQCSNYENRPQICRTDLARLLQKEKFYLQGVNIEEYLIARCKLLQHLKKWKEETKEFPQGQKALLSAIAKAKL